MSNITASPEVDQVKPEDLARYTAIFLKNVKDVINGRLDFGNFNFNLVTFNFPLANTQYGFAHGLGRVPIGYLFCAPSGPANIYSGTSPSTVSTIYLISTAGPVGGLFLVF